MNVIEVIPKIFSIDEKEYFQIEIFVDGKPLVDFDHLAVNYRGLMNSIKGSGEYYILTCTCGISECASIYNGFQVEFKGNLVNWSMQLFDIEEQGFSFEKDLYINAIQTGCEKAVNLLTSIQSSDRNISVVGSFHNQL